MASPKESILLGLHCIAEYLEITPRTNYCSVHRTRMSWEITDGWVVRAGVSVTGNVLSWSGGHEFEPDQVELGGCSTSVLSRTVYLNQNLSLLFWNKNKEKKEDKLPTVRTFFRRTSCTLSTTSCSLPVLVFSSICGTLLVTRIITVLKTFIRHM